MGAVNTHLTQNNKIKHTLAIHRLLRPHTPTALQRTFQVLYLLHKVLHSGRHHVTFCCSKYLNRTLLLSGLTRPSTTDQEVAMRDQGLHSNINYFLEPLPSLSFISFSPLFPHLPSLPPCLEMAPQIQPRDLRERCKLRPARENGICSHHTRILVYLEPGETCLVAAK